MVCLFLFLANTPFSQGSSIFHDYEVVTPTHVPPTTHRSCPILRDPPIAPGASREAGDRCWHHSHQAQAPSPIFRFSRYPELCHETEDDTLSYCPLTGHRIPSNLPILGFLPSVQPQVGGLVVRIPEYPHPLASPPPRGNLRPLFRPLPFS